jgi:uncharacterized protein with GYD domain
MPIYVLLSKLTCDGRKTVKERPERIKEVDKEIETYGAKVLAQYVTIALYDFVNIVEAPDNATIARVAVELMSRGSIRIQTLAAIPMDEFIAKFK